MIAAPNGVSRLGLAYTFRTAAFRNHHGKALEASGKARLLWASPFRPTVPGTDIYTDQLW